MDKIEVGSKWMALVDNPWGCGVSFGEVVEVISVVSDLEIIFSNNNNDRWYGESFSWKEHFTPVDFEIGHFYDPDLDDTPTKDNVNSPSHYGQGKIEAIEYISDFLTPEEYQGYLRGNIAKYLHRFPYKNGLEDLKKAQWYLERLIQEVE